MRCGDLGHVGNDGRPCGQNIGQYAKGCPWHAGGREGASRFALRGVIASRRKHVAMLPLETQSPEFASPDEILTYAATTARQVVVGELSPQLSAEARGWASVALKVHEIKATERLAAAVLQIERGGHAIVLLQQLQASIAEGKRRPLPGRVVPLPPNGDGAA